MAPHQAEPQVSTFANFVAGAVCIVCGAWLINWMMEAADAMEAMKAHKRRELDKSRHLKGYREGFLAGFNFAVGKGGLPPEIIDWPSALKEVTQDHDPNCS